MFLKRLGYTLLAALFTLILLPNVGSKTYASTFRAAPPVQSVKVRLPHVMGNRQVATKITSMSSSPLVYNGGHIIQKQSTSYAILWEPPTLPDGTQTSVSPNYNTLIEQYFNDIGRSSLYNNNTQYYDNFNGHIVNKSFLGGVWLDTTTSYPTPSDCTDSNTPHGCMIDTDIQTEILEAMKANGWTGGLNHIFFVFTSWGEGSCTNSTSKSCFTSPYCAYHNAFDLNSNNPIIYANMPYMGTDLSACGVPTSPNHDFDSDSTINVISHEQMESVTDPLGNAWYDSNGNEIGDKCNFIFPNPLPLDNKQADVKWNNHYYIVQEEWSNYIKNNGKQTGCTLSQQGILLHGTIYAYTPIYMQYSEANLDAYNTSDGTTRWVYTCQCKMSNPAFDAKKGVIYIINGWNLEAINASTGQQTSTQFQNNGSIWYGVNPVVYDSNIYVVSGEFQGTINAYSPSGELLWNYPTQDEINYPMSVSGGVVYFEAYYDNLYYVYALNATTGTLLWKYTLPTGVSIQSPFTENNGVLYFSVYSSSAQNSYIYALQESTQTLLWTYQTPTALQVSPTVENGVVYFAISDQSGFEDLYALFANDGTPEWSPYITPQKSTSSNVVVSGSSVYFGGYAVNSVNASTGILQWSKVPSQVDPDYYNLIVTNGQVFVSTGAGELGYMLNTKNGSLRSPFGQNNFNNFGVDGFLVSLGMF